MVVVAMLIWCCRWLWLWCRVCRFRVSQSSGFGFPRPTHSCYHACSTSTPLLPHLQHARQVCQVDRQLRVLRAEHRLHGRQRTLVQRESVAGAVHVHVQRRERVQHGGGVERVAASRQLRDLQQGEESVVRRERWAHGQRTTRACRTRRRCRASRGPFKAWGLARGGGGGRGRVLVYGCMAVWLYGCMGVWMYGCKGAWVYGCTDVWAYG
eukprot:42300-Chlamydomonas_euryale.AAC.2